MKFFLLGLMLALAAGTADARERSIQAKRVFVHQHPCPSTGSIKLGHCTGYVIDHVIPLCSGGPDRPSNMQWEPLTESHAKDGEERRLCNQVKARKIPKGSDRTALCQALGADFPLMRKSMQCPQ